MKLNKAFNTAEVAWHYYAATQPGRYTREQARKQFLQDNRIDMKELKKVLRSMTKQATIVKK